MIVSQKEGGTLFEQQIKMLFPPFLLPKNTGQLISQADFTEKCELLSIQMASIFQFQEISDSYDDYLEILNELLSMNTDTINYPYNTFNSYSIPRILVILMKEFPDSEVFFKSFELSHILSRNSACARQFCGSDLIPLIFSYLTSLFQEINDQNISIILMLLSILSNIFSNTDEGMVKYCYSAFDLLMDFFEGIQVDIIIDNILLIISSMLSYHQYFDEEHILKIATFFIDYINVDIQLHYSRILFILHQIIDISKESIPYIVNTETIPIFITLTANPSCDIMIATILIFISFLKRSEDEYKGIIYDALSWEWFELTWKGSQPEMQGSLIELFYYIIKYNEKLLKSAVGDQIVSMIFESFENSPFSLRVIIIQNIIRIILLGDTDFLILLIGNNFLSTLDEFISLNCMDSLPFIINFYYYLLQLLDSGQIAFESIDLDDLHDQLCKINPSNLDLEVAKKLKVIIYNISQPEENS